MGSMAQTSFMVSLFPLFPKFTSGSLPETSGGLWRVTVGSMNLLGEKRSAVNPVSSS